MERRERGGGDRGGADRAGLAAAAGGCLPAPGQYLCGLTWDGAHLWHSDQGAARIFAIDRADGSVVRSFPCRHVRADLTYDGSVLCQVGGRPKRLVLVDALTGAVTGERKILPADGRVTGAEVSPAGLWLLLRSPTVVQLRDYPAMTVRREHSVPGAAPSGLTRAGGYVVVGQFDPGALHVLDAATGEHLASALTEGRPTGLTWDGERLWYCDFPGRVLRALELDDVLP